MAKNLQKINISKDYYEAIPHTAIDGFWIVDMEGKLLDVNDTYCKMIGYSRDELLKMKIAEVEVIEKPEEIATRIKKIMEIGDDHFETKHQRKDGRIIDIEVSVNYLKGRNQMAVFLRDITKCKKTEEEVRKKTEESGSKTEELSRMRLMFYSLAEDIQREKEKTEGKVHKRTKELEESRIALMNILEDVEGARKTAEEERDKTSAIIVNLTDGLLVFDKENKLSLVNPLAESFFDIKIRDLIGRSISELSIFPKLQPLAKVLGQEIRKIFRKEILVKEGLTLEVSTVPVLRKEEKLGSLVILHNISRETMIEKMKTEFVSLAAHQLRTPLSAIKWTLKMLLDGDLGKITEEQKNFITKTYSSNERMIGLVNDLLNVARIEEGRYIYKPALLEFGPIVQFAINSYKEEAERRKLKLEFKKPESKSPRVMVDMEKIRLVIQNFLDNAVKYTPVGGKVTVLLKYAPKEIELSVKDSGVGIPKDQQGRVFAKFFRGANVVRMDTEGTGLGLFISKNIVEAHGGRIWFESEEGKGTTFYLTLPVKEEFEEFLKEF